jgi:hypothetical protein
MSLPGLPAELIERVVLELPFSDICSLRLTNKCLASKADQKRFKASFRTKKFELTEQQLRTFVAVTASGGPGCHLQNLTLVALVYNTLELTDRLKSKQVNIALPDYHYVPRPEWQDLTNDELRKAELDLAVLEERLAEQLDLQRRQRDVNLP